MLKIIKISFFFATNPLNSIFFLTQLGFPMKKSLKLSALSTSMLLSVTGCNSETDNVTYTPVTINIAQINEHHSHLEADNRQTFKFNGESSQA